jgi:hypothetical protein
MKTIATAVATLLAALSIVTGVQAAGNPCQSTIDQYLQDHGIDASQIHRIVVVPLQRPSHDGDRVLGIEARIRMLSCRGSVVLEMNQSCHLRQAYGRGACKA